MNRVSSKIWRLVEPVDTSFARAALRSPGRMVSPGVCDRCHFGATYETPVPIVIEWEPGSNLVGDFVWPSGTRVIAQVQVLDEIAAKFGGVEAGAVEMVQDPKLRRPERPARRSKPRVWLPYSGPGLVEMNVTNVVRSCLTTTEVSSVCRKCGRESSIISGVEEKAHRWDSTRQELIPRHVPRKPGHGIFVRGIDPNEIALFRLSDGRGSIYCTDALKRLVGDRHWTNIDFLEYGEVMS